MNVKQRIEQIYSLVEKIPVAGGSVDIMATVRAELRALHKIALAQEKKERNEIFRSRVDGISDHDLEGEPGPEGEPALETAPDPYDRKEKRDG